jgi:hypothetical protein
VVFFGSQSDRNTLHSRDGKRKSEFSSMGCPTGEDWRVSIILYRWRGLVMHIRNDSNCVDVGMYF